MTTAMTTDKKTIKGQLAKIKGQIKREAAGLGQAMRRGLEHARRIGELLAEVRGITDKKYRSWVRANTGFTVRTADLYVQIFARWKEIEGKADDISQLTYSGAIKLLQAPKVKAATTPPPSGPIEPTGKAVEVLHADVRQLAIPAGTARLVLSDPPYSKDSLPLYDELGKLAAHVLEEGGVLLAACGHMYLPEVLAALGKHLQYRWLITSVWAGGGHGRMYQLDVTEHCQLWAMFSKGTWKKTGKLVPDVYHSAAKEKGLHNWQKPIADIKHLIEHLTEPGELVVDPFSGSGTTAAACLELGRRCISADIDAKAVEIGQDRIADMPSHTVVTVPVSLDQRTVVAVPAEEPATLPMPEPFRPGSIAV